MFGVTFYIMACSARNRLRRRLARLREPRYLIGAIVGVAYLFFSIFGRNLFGRQRRRGRLLPAAFLPLAGGSGPVAAGLALAGAAALSMLMPFGSGLLSFSRTEREFLFASPLSSRQLLFYRLMRSQWAVLFSALIIALTYPLATPGARLRSFFGAWLALMTSQVFFTGVTLSRVRLAAPSLRARLVAWLPRVWIAATIAVVVAAAVATVQSQGAGVASAGDIVRLLVAVGQSGWPNIALWPFKAVAAPLFAESFVAWAVALLGATAVYAVVVGWVVSADAAFEAITDTLVEHQQPAAPRRASYRPRRMVWRLALEGREETPFIWKSVTQTLRVANPRLLLRLIVIAGWMTVVLVLFAGRARGVSQLAGIVAALGAVFTVVFGPQVVRLDLRQDLQHLELLKTWPVRVSALIRGQMLGAAAVVTAITWALGAMALVLSTAAFPRIAVELRVASGVALIVAAPALILAQYTVHNAAALFFPAWIASGSSRPRGVDAMGQRLIMLAGTWLVLIVAVVPGVLVGGVLWFGFARLVGPWMLIPGAVAGAMVVLFEVALATEALGPVYERLDVTSVERSEH